MGSYERLKLTKSKIPGRNPWTIVRRFDQIFLCPHYFPLSFNTAVQSQELSEAGVKVGMLEKKVELADAETARKVAAEREEGNSYKAAMEEQERWDTHTHTHSKTYIKLPMLIYLTHTH